MNEIFSVFIVICLFVIQLGITIFSIIKLVNIKKVQDEEQRKTDTFNTVGWIVLNGLAFIAYFIIMKI